MKKEFVLCRDAEGDLVSVSLDLEEKQGRHFDTGEEIRAWTLSISGSSRHFGGQISDVIHRMLVQGDAEFFIDRSDVGRLLEIWNRWHLSDMKAGTTRQELALRDIEQRYGRKFDEYEKKLQALETVGLDRDPQVLQGRAEVIELWKERFDKARKSMRRHEWLRVFDNFHYDSDAHRGAEGNLKKAHSVLRGLHEGYRYGSDWLLEPVPWEVVEEIASIFDRGMAAEAKIAPEDPLLLWMKAHELHFEKAPASRNPHMNSPPGKMRHYECTFANGNGEVTVYFSKGMAHEPGVEAKEVLECLASDFASYRNASDFESWAEELGINTDSIKEMSQAEGSYEITGELCEGFRRLVGSEGLRQLIEGDYAEILRGRARGAEPEGPSP